MLGRIRDALAEFPTDQLSRVERDAVESTRQALDAHLGPVDPPTDTGDVPGGGLEAHEDAGSHLIQRHAGRTRTEENTSELQSIMRISYAGCCIKVKDQTKETRNKRP